VVINVHHHADLIEDELRRRCRGRRQRAWHGAEIVVSRETSAALETGGGLKRAGPCFRPGEPILLHNVDVISDIDLVGMVARHVSTGALATLAVAPRPTSRHLVFDEGGLCGRVDSGTGREEWARQPEGEPWIVGFTGVHVVSWDFVGEIEEDGVFSILVPYLRLARVPGRVRAFDVSGCRWMDVGTPERLAAARAELASGPGGDARNTAGHGFR
jgi:NDP-sugar pyrophosphorylase family protein